MISWSSTMSQPLVKVHVHGPTGTIILNRPEKRNALSRALLAELSQALADLHQERKVRAVVLAASGPAFCAGMDLGEMLETSKAADSHTQWHADAVIYRDLLETMLRFPKPLIAAVGGPAMAGGAGLVLACDIVVASDTATFGLPEPRRGVVAGMVCAALDVPHRRRPGGLSAVVQPDDQRSRSPSDGIVPRGGPRRQSLAAGQ